jgi:hypothetical protein
MEPDLKHMYNQAYSPSVSKKGPIERWSRKKVARRNHALKIESDSVSCKTRQHMYKQTELQTRMTTLSRFTCAGTGMCKQNTQDTSKFKLKEYTSR